MPSVFEPEFGETAFMHDVMRGLDAVQIDPIAPIFPSQVEEGGEQGHPGVENIERDERVGLTQVDDAGGDQRAKADAEVDQHEVDAEGALSMFGRDKATEHGRSGAPARPAKDRDQQGGHEGLLVSVGEGQKTRAPASAA